MEEIEKKSKNNLKFLLKKNKYQNYIFMLKLLVVSAIEQLGS